MLKAFASLLFIATCAGAALAQDPVKVEPNHYKVEFENSQVRVLRVKIGPGEKSIMHRHPNAVAIFLADANGKFTFPNGTTQDISRKAGDVLWTPAVVHQPENAGTAAFEVILVELKPARRARHAHATRSRPRNN